MHSRRLPWELQVSGFNVAISMYLGYAIVTGDEALRNMVYYKQMHSGSQKTNSYPQQYQKKSQQD